MLSLGHHSLSGVEAERLPISGALPVRCYSVLICEADVSHPHTLSSPLSSWGLQGQKGREERSLQNRGKEVGAVLTCR